jgi:hypothetical protein
MTTQELEALKLALEKGNGGYFHGDMRTVLPELVDELLEARQCMDELGVHDLEDAKRVGRRITEFEEYQIKMDEFIYWCG